MSRPNAPLDAARDARLRDIEDEIGQAQEAIGMAQGNATDTTVADELEALQNERDRLLTEIRSADVADKTER
ncbi:MAG TPA: hypothetical protein VIN77_03030 [Aurantimonas sp.]|uniref:Uncharacterized protein n=1 Tax=Aurantimonas marianensis TaxID=2920428 RepID=A0A9X2KDK5_9HYPH|nr:hypothetical protein [Aurantimonas marianensis]MCP3054473.1 hypothetical protein [Aurantimonas marianensis]